MPTFYAYILRSSKSKIFYYGHTKKLPDIRTAEHNAGIMKSTKAHIPWKLVWYGAFETLQQAKNFERYLKSGSGKAFAYKRLVNVALKKDVQRVETSVPKS
jgi:predicted GIY-YIG superfamily endonuclease